MIKEEFSTGTLVQEEALKWLTAGIKVFFNPAGDQAGTVSVPPRSP